MSSSARQASEVSPSFDERLDILAGELELAVKWQRPCILLLVYSSEYVRADVEAALENCLIDLGQKSIHLRVKDRDPDDVTPFFREFKEPAHAVFQIDGFRWGKGDDARAFSTIDLQREYFVDQRIRTIFWVTQNEIVRLAHAAPDFWAHRHRVIEFIESPKADEVLRRALDSAWQGTGEYTAEYADTDAKISLREALLTELPRGGEAISIRGNLMLTLGVLNWRKGDFEKADEQLQEALRIATKIQNNWFEAECFNALALIKSSTRQIDEAIDAYKQAIQLAPDQMFVWNNLGSLCTKVGRNDEAMIAFRKALQGNSRDPIAWNGIAGLHFHLGYVDDAIAAYRKAIQYSPSFAQPWCGLGDVYASTGRADEALKCYHKAIDLNPRYVAPWLRLGVLFAKQARYRDAVKAYQKAIALDPRNTRTWNELGAIYVKSKSLGEAADAFRKAIELDRRNGWAYSNLASAYMQQGKHKETISLLLRSIDLFENDADRAMSWNQLARAYRLLGDYRNAVAAYQTADKLAPGRPAAKAERPTEGHEPSATQTTGVPMPEWKGEVPTPSPQDAPVEAGAEAVTTACGPLTAGAETLNRGGERLRIPEAPAWIFEAAGEPDEPVANPPTAKKKPSNKERSAAAVTQAPALPAQVPAKPASPNSVEDSQTTERSAPRPEAAEWTEKGNALFHQGAFEEAAAAYNHAIQLDSAYGVPYSNLALTYLTQGKCAEAILLYQKSIDLLESDKDRALACNGLGNAYRCTNDYASAVTAYQRAADLDPETSGIRERADDSQASATPRSAQAWNNLGELLLKTRALDQAADAFSKAIDLEPTNGRAYCNLARTRAAQIRYREAVPLYEKSIGLLENDKDKANAWNGLGNAYRKLNDYDNAIRAYREAVALADEGVDLLTRTRFSLLSNCDVSQ